MSSLGTRHSGSRRAISFELRLPESQSRRTIRPVSSTIRDLGYGIRTLWRNPGFALAAILTIALGIAGNTAIFSAIDEQVLRSLPVSHPEDLVELQPSGLHDSFPIPVFEYLRDHEHG